MTPDTFDSAPIRGPRPWPRTRPFVAAICGLLLLAAGYAIRPLAIPQLPRDARALEFVDRDGLPLGTILGRGERRTLPVALSRVAPQFVAAAIAAEDSRF